MQKELVIIDLLKSNFLNKLTDNDEWWYIWTDTSYKDGYESLKKMIDMSKKEV